MRGPLSRIMAMVVGGLAVLSLYGTAHRAVFWAAVIYLMGTVWYMMFIRTLSSKIGVGGWGHVSTNMRLDGRSGNDIRSLGNAIRDVVPAPDLRYQAWLPRVNLIVLCIGVALLICGITLRW